MGAFRFDPDDYGAVIAGLLAGPRVAELGPGVPVRLVEPALRRFDPRIDLGAPAADPIAARAFLAGLWLYFDFLDESHRISQDLETPDGSFWHAILHRREPDAWNSKYWWRKVGSHPVLNLLAEQAPSLGYHYANPHDFVNFCERVRGSGSAEEEAARRVQLLEWQLLFDHCYRQTLPES